MMKPLLREKSTCPCSRTKSKNHPLARPCWDLAAPQSRGVPVYPFPSLCPPLRPEWAVEVPPFLGGPPFHSLEPMSPRLLPRILQPRLGGASIGRLRGPCR